MTPAVRSAVILRDRSAVYALYLDFKNGIYRGSTGRVSAISSVPGYTYTRTGAKSELGPDGSTLLAFLANAPGIVPGVGYWSRAALTNLFLNNAVGATQSITTTAQAYTLSFFGTGTITLTGTSTSGPLVGTGANNRVALTFTPTAGTLTLTVSGSCTNVEMVAGSFAGPIIATTGSTAATGADNLRVTPPATSDEDGVLLVAVTLDAVSAVTSAAILVADNGSSSERIRLNNSGTHLAAVVTDASASIYDSGSALPAGAVGRQVIAIRRRSGKWTGAAKAVSGTVTVATESGALAFPSGLSRLDIGDELGFVAVNAPVEFVGYIKGTFSDSDLSNLLRGA
jgi:hypothetical protein